MRKFVTNRDNTYRSGFAKQIENILKQEGIAFLPEYPFLPYTVDIYIPEWHIAIEADGPLHSKRKDKVKDEYLLTFDKLPVLRINQNGFKTARARKAIIDFIELHADSAKERKERASR